MPINRFASSYATDYSVFQVDNSLLTPPHHEKSPSLLFLRLAVDEALTQAGLTPSGLRKLRIGACIGCSVKASFILFFYRKVRAGVKVPTSHFVSLSLKQSQTVVTACASGTDAIGIAAE